MAFSSAWQISGYFFSRFVNLSSSSSMPRGNPLNPVERISLSSPTTTQPTLVEGSLLHKEMCLASSMNLKSHLLLIRTKCPCANLNFIASAINLGHYRSFYPDNLVYFLEDKANQSTVLCQHYVHRQIGFYLKQHLLFQRCVHYNFSNYNHSNHLVQFRDISLPEV